MSSKSRQVRPLMEYVFPHSNKIKRNTGGHRFPIQCFRQSKAEAYPATHQTSNMECFAKIVFTRHFILDILQGSEYTYEKCSLVSVMNLLALISLMKIKSYEINKCPKEKINLQYLPCFQLSSVYHAFIMQGNI